MYLIAYVIPYQDKLNKDLLSQYQNFQIKVFIGTGFPRSNASVVTAFVCSDSSKLFKFIVSIAYSSRLVHVCI